jgi:hypothetical protein
MAQAVLNSKRARVSGKFINFSSKVIPDLKLSSSNLGEHCYCEEWTH